MRVNVGESFSLKCAAAGENGGSVAWLRDNIPLREGGEVNSVNGVLTISTMREEYLGWYTCTAGTLNHYQEKDYLLLAGKFHS